MLVILCVAIVLVATVTTSVKGAGIRRARRTARNPMAQVFRRREFRQLDVHLEAVAREEIRRLEQDFARYLAGRAGYVVVVAKAPNGIALELSDGRRLALHGISRRTVELLTRCAPADMLRPESFVYDAVYYRVLLRGHAGTEIKVYARNIALAA
jgi:hypothetical protein